MEPVNYDKDIIKLTLAGTKIIHQAGQVLSRLDKHQKVFDALERLRDDFPPFTKEQRLRSHFVGSENVPYRVESSPVDFGLWGNAS